METSDGNRKVAVSGATGFIGGRLTEHLVAAGWQVVPLGRGLLAAGAEERLAQALAGCGAVVNLAGAPIDRRWTRAYRKQLYDSRVGVTRRLVAAINAQSGLPRVLVSASAAGYYPETGCYSEYDQAQGAGFLAGLCGAWEHEARQVDPRVRLAVTRFGVVLAPRGGAFRRMTLPMRLGVAARIGSGRQPMAWIDREDLVRVLGRVLEDDGLSGVINCVAPQRIDNAEFTRIAGRYYHDAVRIPIPVWAMRVVFGEMAGVLTGGQCVVPAKLQEAGFAYRSPDIGAFLERLKEGPK